MRKSIEVLRLAGAGHECLLAPALGGAVLAARKEGFDLLRPAEADAVAEDPRNAACFSCAPYFGRLPGGLDFGGRRFPLGPTLPAADPDNALHGETWLRAWRVVAVSEDVATLAFRWQADEPGRYPFAYSAEQRVSLTTRGMTITLRLRNDARERAPFGLALHPFFVRDPTTRIGFDASSLWTFDPVHGGGAQTAIPDKWRYDPPQAPPEVSVDHAFAGFGGVATVVRRDGLVRLESTTPVLHLYAPADADFLCLEPATHRPGVLGPAEAIDPGAEIAITMLLSA